MVFLYIILSLIVYIALIFATISVAGNKNRSQLGFGLFAAFFPVIALIVVLIISPGQPGAVIEAEEKIEE